MTEPHQNHRNGLLQTLAARGDKWVQMAILVLVAVSGGGNFLKTSNVSDLAQVNHLEIHRALEQISRIDSVVDDAIKRQKEINESIKDVLKELKQQQQQKQNP